MRVHKSHSSFSIIIALLTYTARVSALLDVQQNSPCRTLCRDPDTPAPEAQPACHFVDPTINSINYKQCIQCECNSRSEYLGDNLYKPGPNQSTSDVGSALDNMKTLSANCVFRVSYPCFSNQACQSFIPTLLPLTNKYDYCDNPGFANNSASCLRCISDLKDSDTVEYLRNVIDLCETRPDPFLSGTCGDAVSFNGVDIDFVIKGKKKLSAGAIGGIVAGVGVLAIVALVLCCLFVLRPRRENQNNQLEADGKLPVGVPGRGIGSEQQYRAKSYAASVNSEGGGGGYKKSQYTSSSTGDSYELNEKMSPALSAYRDRSELHNSPRLMDGTSGNPNRDLSREPSQKAKHSYAHYQQSHGGGRGQSHVGYSNNPRKNDYYNNTAQNQQRSSNDFRSSSDYQANQTQSKYI